jgi:8-oxo-dGTP diphosphatase
MLISEKKHFDIWNPELTIPVLALDIVIFTIYRGELCVVLTKMQDKYVKWIWIPGWIVARGFTLEQNFDDILKRKTGIEGVYKEQLYTFWDPWRDTRAHVVAVCYYALVSVDSFVNNVDFTKVDIVKVSDISSMELLYDHAHIIAYAHQRLKWKMEYTNVAKEILPKKFKMSELQKVYETITGKEIDKRNFQKKIFSLEIVKETWEKDKSTNRPAKLYTFRDQDLRIIDMM